jgi:hypothetical protein
VGAGPKNRRLLNAAFFNRLYVDDDDTIRSELAPPFDLLLRQDPSAASTEQTVDWKTWEASFNNNDPETGPEVAGLKEHHLVGAAGIEPATSRV